MGSCASKPTAGPASGTGAACSPPRGRKDMGAKNDATAGSSTAGALPAHLVERQSSDDAYFDALAPTDDQLAFSDGPMDSLPLAEKTRSPAFLGPLPVKIDLEVSNKAVREKDSATYKNTFSDPDPAGFLVRGPRYFTEGAGGTNLKHLKQPAIEPPYSIDAVQEIRCPRRMPHASQEIGNLQRYFDSFPADEANQLPRFFVYNWVLSSLGAKECIVVNHVFKRKDHMPRDEALMTAYNRFIQASTEEKNAQFKFMFKVVDCPASLKTAIAVLGGERPVIIGKQLTTTYYRGKNYLEVNVDVSSSKIASMLNTTIFSQSGTLVHEHCWLLQAGNQNELPERVLALLRWNWNVPKEVEVFVDNNGEVLVAGG